jgi:outer membrane protein assembly factor BamB
MCLDRKTGKTLWQKVAREAVPHEGHHKDHGYSSHSPVTDGEHVFAYFGSRGLYCFDLDGNPKWQKDLGRQRTRNGFGEGSSPALFGDTIVVNWDHEGDDDFCVAFDKTTGAERWRVPRAEATNWSTPLIVEHAGRAQVIVSATQRIRSYDLATGKQIWECGGMTGNTIPCPVADDGTVYVTSGFRGAALLAIRLGRTGDLTGTDAVAWSQGKGTPYVPSPLLYEGRLYLFAGNNSILSSFDAKTGKPLIDSQRVDDLEGVYASPVGAAGHVYLVGRNGVTTVIKSSDKLEEVATNRLDDRIDASPAAVGDELFLRGHQYLYCIGAK